MTRLRHLALTAALLTALSPLAANAGARLGLGADYWVNHGGLFELTLGVDTPLVRNVHLGARFGGMISTISPTFGVPLDLDLRVNFGRIYLEGLVGPWIFFDNANPFRAHAAIGFGIHAQAVTFGLELGYLQPDAHAGLRLAWSF